MTNSGMLKVAIVNAFIILISLFGIAIAALPPGAYDELKSQASEYIKVEILKTEAEGSDTICRIEVTYLAKVIEIFRSKRGLQINDEIIIRSYDREETPVCTDGWAGPQVPRLLNEGWLGNAYLNLSDVANGEFDIAANGQSFEESESNTQDNEGDSGNVGCFIVTSGYR